MAMPDYQGPTLKTALAGLPVPPSEAQLRALASSGPGCAGRVPSRDCFHRDVSPENILLTSTGPLLLDFGAARRVISDRTQALTAVLKPGFAPIEQYGGNADAGPVDRPVRARRGGALRDHRPAAGRLGGARRARTRAAAGRNATRAGTAHAFLQAIDAALALRPEDAAAGRTRVPRHAGCRSASGRVAGGSACARPRDIAHRGRPARSDRDLGRTHRARQLGFDRGTRCPAPGPTSAASLASRAQMIHGDAGLHRLFFVVAVSGGGESGDEEPASARPAPCRSLWRSRRRRTIRRPQIAKPVPAQNPAKPRRAAAGFEARARAAAVERSPGASRHGIAKSCTGRPCATTIPGRAEPWVRPHAETTALLQAPPAARATAGDAASREAATQPAAPARPQSPLHPAPQRRLPRTVPRPAVAPRRQTPATRETRAGRCRLASADASPAWRTAPAPATERSKAAAANPPQVLPNPSTQEEVAYLKKECR